VEELWNALALYAQSTPKTPEFDGKKMWQIPKGIFKLVDDSGEFKGCWFDNVPRDCIYCTNVMNMIEWGSNGKSLGANHFIMQTVRLPTTKPASIRRIMQVALNVGFCKKEAPSYNLRYGICRDFIDAATANTRVYSFMSAVSIVSLNSFFRASF
jgi:hypothetical protein